MQNFSKAGKRARRPSPREKTVADRLWERTAKDGPGGCWMWTGQLNEDGYPFMDTRVEGKTRRTGAHRLMYELLVGPIPPGLTLDHVWERGCRFRHCVNPEHMEPVTRLENARRANRVQGGGRKHGACFAVGPRAYLERLAS